VPSFNTKQVVTLMDELIDREFYGVIEISFISGRITQVKMTESINPLRNKSGNIRLSEEST